MTTTDNASAATTKTETALVPAGNTKPEKSKKSKKDEPVDPDKAKTVHEERKLLWADEGELLIPTQAAGAPQWLIEAHGERVKSMLVDGLVESIRDDGVKKPGEAWNDHGKLWILDGVQRYRGFIDANKMLRAESKPLRRFPYFVVEKTLSSAQLFALTMKLNAFVKKDDAVATSHKAAALYKLAREDGLNDTAAQRLVADALGNISPAMVHNYLVMNTASPKLKKMVADKVVSASVVMELAHLPQEEQEKALEEAAKASGVTDKTGKPVATVTSAKSIVKSKQGKYKEDEPIDAAGVKRIIASHITDGLAELDDETVRIMRFCMGQLSAKDARVKGMTAMVRYISGK